MNDDENAEVDGASGSIDEDGRRSNTTGNNTRYTEDDREQRRVEQSKALLASSLGQRMSLDAGDVRKGVRANPSNTHAILRARETGKYPFSGFDHLLQAKLLSRYLPCRFMRRLDQFDSRIFCGTYSEDGSQFLSATQDGRITVYDDIGSKEMNKRVFGVQDVGWAIVDTAFSPDQSSIVYSSWSQHLYYIDLVTNQTRALDFRRHMCPFSIVYSMNNKEVMAGSNLNAVMIFDLELNRLVLAAHAHDDDVNAVGFADSSSHVFFSGSDDRKIKVWDRRMLTSANPRAVGAFLGHYEGITYIDPKRDGVHLISQSKDSSIKLWDMRKMSSPEEPVAISRDYDYRYARPNQTHLLRAPLSNDTSLMTYVGHSVARTLLRARFSPIASTGQKYIVSASADGDIVIYDTLTGMIAHRLSGHSEICRDVSWHPFESSIISSSWDGSHVQWSHFEMQDSHHPGSISVSDPGEEREEWQSDDEESSIASEA